MDFVVVEGSGRVLEGLKMVYEIFLEVFDGLNFFVFETQRLK